MVKYLGIIDSDNKDIIFAIEKYFKLKNVDVKVVSSDYDMSEFDLVVLTGYECKININHSNILYVYPTLLPAFYNVDNPILESFYSGVKVSGVTISNLISNKILAQYPVLIGLDTTFDDLSSELSKIAQKIYPLVIESVLYDKVFDFNDLLNSSSCSGNCGKCGSCR